MVARAKRKGGEDVRSNRVTTMAREPWPCGHVSKVSIVASRVIWCCILRGTL